MQHDHFLLIVILVILIVILVILFWPDSDKRELREINRKLDKIIAQRARHYDDGK